MQNNNNSLPSGSHDPAAESGEENAQTGRQTVNPVADKTSEVAQIATVSPLLKSVYVLAGTVLLLIVAVVALIIGSVMIWVKKPDTVVIKENQSGVIDLVINGRSFGEISQPTLAKQVESDKVKIYLAKQFAEMAYAVNPETRASQLKRLLNWFPEDEAKTRTLFSNALNQIKNDPNACMPFALEVSQGWYSTISIQEAKSDPSKPNIVDVLLVQNLQRRATTNVAENRQLSLQIDFGYSGISTEDNFMSGYYPKFITCRVLPSATPVITAPQNVQAVPQQQPPAQVNTQPVSAPQSAPQSAQTIPQRQ